MEGPIGGPYWRVLWRALLEGPIGGPYGGSYWRALLEGPIGGPYGGPSWRALLEGPCHAIAVATKVRKKMAKHCSQVCRMQGPSWPPCRLPGGRHAKAPIGANRAQKDPIGQYRANRVQLGDPKWVHMEAEGRPNGGLGAKPPEEGPVGP